MGILSWIIFGLLAGGLAKFIIPGKDPGGCFLTILLGVAGAALGGWIGTQLGFGTVNAFDLRSLGLAILGAVILLLLYRVIRGQR
jgi:uncharacterized membrane protein YeaQ/YmgE (transglycosylase-associated protein family)